MTNRIRCFLFALVLLLPLQAPQAKGADGLVLLKGTVQGANTTDDLVSFLFTGRLSFSFFTAAQDDAARKRIDLEFDVRQLPVQIPKFGDVTDESKNNPFIVNFGNAAKHAAEASKTGEVVSVVLFRPVISYDIHGIIEKLACTHAQVMPERMIHQLRGYLSQ